MIERLEEALGHRPLMTLNDMVAELGLGHAHMLTTAKSLIYVRLDQPVLSKERGVLVGPAAGDLNEIIEALPHLEEWARGEKCTQALVTGRRGWVRALAPHGYEEYATVLRKLL